MGRFCVIGFVLVLAAGGCSAGATEEPSPTTSRSVVTEQPTATASETVPAPPEMPAEAKEMTEAGADAFARHWFDVVEYAYATGNAEPLRALADPECEICNASIAEIESKTREGLHFEGVAIEVLTSAPAPKDSRGVIVTMSVQEVSSQVVTADGEVVEDVPGIEAAPINVYVAESDGGWRIFGIGKI
ncbi:hypothetical protein HJG43_06365 [Kineosporiaceae bacterium SCSIO 59966]|nr:hypothetical protein HJG43_06365 [Kineosporiaceae bacterium SCSIO 59966]